VTNVLSHPFFGLGQVLGIVAAPSADGIGDFIPGRELGTTGDRTDAHIALLSAPRGITGNNGLSGTAAPCSIAKADGS
jgi:hypothetical protein